MYRTEQAEFRRHLYSQGQFEGLWKALDHALEVA
jgi:hypothetical protein